MYQRFAIGLKNDPYRPRPKTNVTRLLKTQSAARKKSAAATDMSSTMTVVIMVSRRVGQVTLATSVRTCCRNSKGLVLAIFSPCRGKPPPASCLPARASVVAGVEGLEPPTPGFGDRCSSQLSYTPNACSKVLTRTAIFIVISSTRRPNLLERVKGIEPSSSAWKAAALPLSYTRIHPAYTKRVVGGG